MKILVVHNSYLESGGEDGVVNSEIRMLEKFGHKVILYKRLNKEIKSLPFFKKISFLTKDIIWSEHTYKEIKNIIEKEKPDIAHIHNIFILVSPSVYGAFREENIPVVQTLHNYRFICPKGILYRNGKICEECIVGNFNPSIFHKCWRNSYILSYFLARVLKAHFKNGTFIKNIDCYIALSKFSKNKFIKAGFPEEKIFIKPNFLELDVGERNDIHNFALFIGRLVDYKGINVLIEAFTKLSSYNLKIIGDGPLYKELNEKTKNICNVELLGKLSYTETIEYIKNSSFVVFPSECYETMPRVVIESFACSVPVLASNIGGAIKELVQEGVTGLLFQAQDRNELVGKIKYLMKNRKLVAYMGKNARKVYEEKYTSEKNYSILMEIYEKLCR